MLAFFVFLTTALRADATDVTPVEKVVMMIKDLQTKVTEEGHMEATTYDKFACFCKSKTDEKVEAISEGETDRDALMTKIQDLQAKRAQLDLDIQALNEEIAGYEEQIAEAKKMRGEEVKTFDSALTDMEKAISALERAIETLKASKPSLAQVKSLVRTSLLMADAMDMAPKSRKVVTMLLSEDQPITDVPVSDYDYHSGGIIETLEGLLNTFRERKTTLESDNETADSDYNMAMQAKLDQLKQAQESLENKQKEKTETTEEIATSQADLTETNAMLNDDRVYLKDLTEKCETKAKLWDQRSQMRADELSALTQALSVLESAVAEKAEATGEGGRSDLVQEETKTEAKSVEPVAFVQEKLVRKMVPDEDAEKREKIVTLLTSMGKKLQSTTLSALALKVAKDDPFKKIKGMIQELIERLLQEEADEGNHKGWCDTEISKTLKDRDYRLRDITDLHSSIEKLNARKEKLNLTKTELTEEIATLEEDLVNQTAAREEEKEEHEQTIKDSEEGLEAIKEAIDILDHFYKTAAKALVQQPTVDDEAPDAGFDDTYKASQGASTGILGMMEVIMGDFERTIKETTAAEEQAKRDFIEYDRETRMSIAAKTNALEATTTELTEVMDNLSTAGDELRTQQELLDTSVKTWEELLPGCVADPGMSYEERVARRNQEMQALKDVYCILDDQEAGCSGVFLQMQTSKRALRGA